MSNSNPDLSQNNLAGNRNLSMQQSSSSSSVADWFSNALDKAYGVVSSLAIPTNSHTFSQSPVWLLGRCYPRCVADDEDAEAIRLHSILRDLFSRVWITYRNGFAPIEWRYKPGFRRAPIYAQILRWFVDLPSPQCVFSIHNMLDAGSCFKKGAGQWFGPGEVCNMLQTCMTRSSIDSVCIFVGNDGVLYLDAITQQCTQITQGPSDPLAHLLSEPKTDSSNESKKTTQAETNFWRSVILLIHVRLGVNHINFEYLRSLLSCFTFPQSIGFMGGRPQSSLYFLGFQDDRVFYLDPHTVQTACPIEQDFSRQSSSFHCTKVRSMPITDIDPSLAIGFYCKTKADFLDFWERAKKMSASKRPVFTLSDKKPEYRQWDDEDESDTSESGNSSPDASESDKDNEKRPTPFQSYITKNTQDSKHKERDGYIIL